VPVPAPTVLYIDDNAANLTLVERLLERRGPVRLVTATEGRQGLALARQERPALILLDLHLPDIEGEELLRQIRQDAALHATAVVVLSAESDPDLPERLQAAGAQGYLMKPIDFQQFFAQVDAALSGGSATAPPRSAT
jgi:CheY-like chemotaxis protein